jgi:uncharacterized delta-60 repeat protein
MVYRPKLKRTIRLSTIWFTEEVCMNKVKKTFESRPVFGMVCILAIFGYHRALLLSTILLTAGFMSSVFAQQPGDLDPTFGNGGKVTGWTGEAHSVTIQSDGKIVVAGNNYVPPGWNSDFVIARYNPDGSVDTSFGTNGRVVTPVTWRYDGAFDVIIQPDEKIVAAGAAETFDANLWELVLVRYNPNGSLDTEFGVGGIATTPGLWGARSVAMQSDGKLVASTYNLQMNQWATARYLTNGSLDTSFGGSGIVSYYAGYGNPSPITIQTDGKIVTGGYVTDTDENFHDFVLVRQNTDGTLDPSFNDDGIFILGFGNYDAPTSVVIQPDGKLIAVTEGGHILRLLTDGSLDAGFGSAGIVFITTANYAVGLASVALQPDGKIMSAGKNWDGSNHDFAIARFNSNGSFDTSFGGGDGISTVDFNNSDDQTTGMALDSQGRVVVVGYYGRTNNSGGTVAIARFNLGTGAIVTNRAPFDFDGDGRSDVSVYRPSDSVWYLNRSTGGFSATQFGVSTDEIVPADYDGDGKTDIAVYRDGAWWRINSATSTVSVNQFGIASDTPVPADYTGDGRDEIAVYRSGQWWMLDLSNGQVSVVNFGVSTDKAVPADYDGDGKVDQAVYRGNGEWHLNRSSQGYTVAQFGLSSDIPLTGDYDGDGKADEAVYRDGTWYLLESTAGFRAFVWGLPTDIPTPADYDGDGKADAAIYREGTWWILKSTGGYNAIQFGLAGDKPAPAAFLVQ